MTISEKLKNRKVIQQEVARDMNRLRPEANSMGCSQGCSQTCGSNSCQSKSYCCR